MLFKAINKHLLFFASITLDVSPIYYTMKTKRLLRLLALMLIVALASVIPVPMTFNRKDETPKYTVEQVDKKDDDIEKGEEKMLF